MNLPRLTWKRNLLLLILAPLAWLLYLTCPCALEIGEEGWAFRLRSQPSTCAVLTLPTFWVLPESTPAQSASDVEYYELRRSKHSTDELFIGLRSMKPLPPVQGTTLRSKNKFALRFYRSDGSHPATVDAVRPASEEDWMNSEVLPYLDSGDLMDLDLRGDVAGNDVVFKGQRYPKREKHSAFSTRRMVSTNQVFIAVPSFGGPLPTGVSFGFSLDPWRRDVTVDIFRVADRAQVARITGWTCRGGLGETQDIVWHADEYFSMPLTADKRQVLLCNFRHE
jgi:hypothetical protein